MDCGGRERPPVQAPLAARIKHIGRFKPIYEFDWSWPKRCDRAAIEALMSLDFFREATNPILVGPNGVGKSTLAKNIAYQALVHGHTVLFTSAGQLLGDLSALIATPPCAGASATMPDLDFSASTRSVIYPIPIATLTYCSNSSAVAMSKKALW
jgi:hypothetical protein